MNLPKLHVCHANATSWCLAADSDDGLSGVCMAAFAAVMNQIYSVSTVDSLASTVIAHRFCSMYDVIKENKRVKIYRVSIQAVVRHSYKCRNKHRYKHMAVF